MRHVINAHESGSHNKKCWFFIMCLKRPAVRTIEMPPRYPELYVKNTFPAADSSLAQTAVEVLRQFIELSFHKMDDRFRTLTFLKEIFRNVQSRQHGNS